MERRLDLMVRAVLRLFLAGTLGLEREGMVVGIDTVLVGGWEFRAEMVMRDGIWSWEREREQKGFVLGLSTKISFSPMLRSRMFEEDLIVPHRSPLVPDIRYKSRET